jgi:hypothetical protein
MLDFFFNGEIKIKMFIFLKMSTISFSLIILDACPGGGVDFWIFDCLQLNLDCQKNSKTKEDRAFFFIFIFFYAEMSFFGPKS